MTEQSETTPAAHGNRGIVYVLTNPAMVGYIKIGKTSGDAAINVIKRMRELDSTEIPRAFHCEYAAVVDDSRAVEKVLHTAFGENRVRKNREFFEGIPPFRVKAILEMIAIADVTPRTSSDATTEDEIERPPKAPVFMLKMADIPFGAHLEWADDREIKCKTISDRQVEYDGEEYALSKLTAKLKGWNVNYTQVGPYWLYEDKTLDEWREQYLSQIENE